MKLSQRDLRFLGNVLDGEDDWGKGNYGVIARNGGDSATIRSLVRRGLLVSMGMVRDSEGEDSTDREGFTLTEAGRCAVGGMRILLATAQDQGEGQR